MSPGQIRTLVEANFEVVPGRSNEQEITILCGLCRDSSGNRGINLTTGLTNCWRCGVGGTLKSYAARVGIELDLSGETTSATLEELEESLEALDAKGPSTGQDLVTEVK